MAVAGECMSEFQVNKYTPHLAYTEAIGLPLQYLISKPIKRSTDNTVNYTLLIMLMIYLVYVYGICRSLRKLQWPPGPC